MKNEPYKILNVSHKLKLAWEAGEITAREIAIELAYCGLTPYIYDDARAIDYIDASPIK